MNIEKYFNNAYLNLPDDSNEKNEQIDKFKKVVDMVEEFMEVDTSDMKCLEITSEINCPFREDIVKPSIDREEVFENTSHREYGYFKLDKILED